MTEPTTVFYSDFYISQKLYPSNLYRNIIEVFGDFFPARPTEPNIVSEKHIAALRNVDYGWVNKALFMLHAEDHIPAGWEFEALHLHHRPVIIVNEAYNMLLHFHGISDFNDFASVGRNRKNFEKVTFQKVGRGIAGTLL